LREDGLLPTLAYCRRWVLYKAHYHAHDRRFEKMEAVPTGRFIDGRDLDVSAEMKAHVTSYLATPRLLVHMAVRSIGEPLEEFSFVDIGSGLGRALLAAGEYRFRAVVGYEISPMLHDAAMRNIEAFRAAGRVIAPIESVNGDALTVEWPAGRTIFFMFNSFGREFTALLLKKLAERAQRGISDYVIFSNMKHGDLIAPGQVERIRPGFLAASYFALASPYPLDIYRTKGALEPTRKDPIARELRRRPNWVE
jgi:SAM-dependent methyltransferase